MKRMVRFLLTWISATKTCWMLSRFDHYPDELIEVSKAGQDIMKRVRHEAAR